VFTTAERRLKKMASARRFSAQPSRIAAENLFAWRKNPRPASILRLWIQVFRERGGGPGLLPVWL